MVAEIKEVQERAMARICKVDDLSSIEGADKIEVAHIGGWRVVVKKGDFKKDSFAVFCEVDSFVSNAIAPFLTKSGHAPKEYNNVLGERLKTIKLKGQISQGLLLPMSVYFEHFADSEEDEGQELSESFYEGMDISTVLGIQKWEPPTDPKLGGSPRGNFPNFIRKTDQERIQNLSRQFKDWQIQGMTWERTEKLHGSSMTVYVNGETNGVCSRNIDLIQEEGNTFWDVAVRDNVHNKLRNIFPGVNLAIQGELCGPGINGNTLKLKEHKFYVFDIFNIDRQEYLLPADRWDMVRDLALLHVPVCAASISLSRTTAEEVLANADGESAITPGVLLEGYVYKSMSNPDTSFKAVSNQWLCKYE